MILSPGQEVDRRYLIDSSLASGGMGEVYRATHMRLNRPVAIKVLQTLSTDPTEHRLFREQFEREARILASLDHPNIVKVTDYFEEGQRGFLVMEFLHGETLGAWIQRHGPCPESIALACIGEILGALAYLHRRNPPIIMRDLKPSNVMLLSDGTCKLIDFGIARAATPGVGTKTIIRGRGTPGYAAPEQHGNPGTDERSDLYALGGTMYFLLSGQDPPDAIARVTAPLKSALHDLSTLPANPPSAPWIWGPVSLRTWEAIQRLMAIAPDDRPQTASEVMALFQAGPTPNAAGSRTANDSQPFDNNLFARGSQGVATGPSDDCEQSVRHARALVGQGKLDEALSYYREAVQIDPSNTDARRELGAVFERRGDLIKAVDTYLMAGQVLLDRSQFDDALKIYNQIISIESSLSKKPTPVPNVDQVRHHLISRRGDIAVGVSIIFLQKGATDEAIKILQGAMEADASHPGMRNMLGLAYMRKSRPSGEAAACIPRDETLARGTELVFCAECGRQTKEEAYCPECGLITPGRTAKSDSEGVIGRPEVRPPGHFKSGQPPS
jgi:serine/threonine-protein kinase